MSPLVPQDPRFVCLIASPRTGSTQLGRVLSSFDRVAAYGEIFHPHASYSLRPHLERLSVRARRVLPSDVKDPVTIDFVRSHPRDVLEVLSEAADVDQVVSFKVFSFHLSKRRFLDEILARDDVLPVFLRRRVIDCHISDLKAEHNRIWRDEDTTTIKVDADIDRFERWSTGQRRWYDWTSSYVEKRGMPVHVLTYESDIEPGEARTARAVADVLTSHGVRLGVDRVEVDSMKKQDRSKNLEEKVGNWSEFERQLRSRGLFDLAMGYFV